ncbi:MAG: hypothetical protein COA69_00995 [Robiginitomaculum sp.]|nr:MAG: hypothetical protein COA69_00995 [Robiginitomaculum sp.]
MNRYGQSAGGGSGVSHGGGGDMTIGDYANGMPNIRLSQIPASFLRQLRWMVPAILVMVAASWWLTKDVKREYQADGRILVQIGSEYVYDPVSGNTNSGINITADQITLTEAEIIKNPDIVNRVINQLIASPTLGGVGGERFAPKLYTKWVKAPASEKADRWNDIVKSVNKSYVVMPKAKSSIINLVYKHEDGEVAVKTLDAFMVSYLDFRNQIFVSETSGLLAEQRALAQKQLDKVERKIQRVLNVNGISEFESERTGAQRRSETLRAGLNTLRGKIAGVEAALAATENQLRGTPVTIDLQIDDRASQRLAQAELERRQLLAKYLPASIRVRNKEAEISEIRAQIRANGGKAVGGRRVGPNPVYQALMTQRNTYQAQADSFREQEITLQSQLNVAIGKVKHMRVLGPSYQNLVREKSTLEDRVKALNAKEQAALAIKQQQNAQMDNVKIITRPTVARKGRNMRKLIFALAVLGSFFSVFMLALLRVFLDPDLYGASLRKQSQLAPVSTPNSAPAQSPAFEHNSMPYQNIPEPVPALVSASVPMSTPMPAPVPTSVPAYGDPYQASPEHMPVAVGHEVPMAYEREEHTPQPYVAQAYPVQDGWVQNGQLPPQQAQLSPQQAYVDNTAGANPYLNTAVPQMQPQTPGQAYAGVENNILGPVDHGPIPGTYVG